MTAENSEIFKRNNHPDAQWFPGTNLGLFLHWGISGVHGGIEISWGMMKNTAWDRENCNLFWDVAGDVFCGEIRYSPAFALGFKQIDMSDVGPRKQ